MEGLTKTREIEGIIRRRMAKIVTACAIGMTVFDIVYFIYGLAAGILPGTPISYLLKRVLGPMLLNTILLTVMWCFENGIHTFDCKNAVVAFSVSSVGGLVAIFHGYHLVLWLAPALGLFFVAISHNKILRRSILVYNYILLTVAYAQQLWEWGDYGSVLRQSVFAYYTQHLIIGYMVLGVVYAFTECLHAHIVDIIEVNQTLLKQSDEYQERVERDALTGCYSRDYLSHHMEKLFRKCSNRLATTCALIDIDDFKKVNDTYGHDCGDQVLERIGKLGRMLGNAEAERPAYRICRYGGEEFLFVFTDRNPVTCQKQIEEFRRVFETQEYDFTDRRITLSGGVVTCSSPQEFNVVFKAVDEALYQAKATGKNKVVVGKGI